MIKCRQILEDTTSPCGKDICCYTCDEMSGCKYKCDVPLEEDENCSDAVTVEELSDTFESKGSLIIEQITKLTTQINDLKEQEKEMRKQLVTAMEKYNVKKFENDTVTFTYKPASTRTSVDSDKLKEDGLYEKYSKTSSVSASVVIKVK